MKKFRNFTLAFLSAFLCIGVGVGVVAGTKSAEGAKAAETTYEMTIDSSAKGSNNVHITSTSQTSLAYNNISWSLSIAGTDNVPGSKTYAQIGSRDYPATSVTLSTSSFANKTIKSVSLTGFCMSNTGPVLNITAGSTNILSDEALIKTTSTVYTSTNTSPIVMGASDYLTFAITSSAKAAICISQIKVIYVGEASTATIDSFNVSNTNTYYTGDTVDCSDFTITPILSDSSTPSSISDYVTMVGTVDTTTAGEKTVTFTYDAENGPYKMSTGVSNVFTSNITVIEATYTQYSLIQNDADILYGANYIIVSQDGSYHWYAMSKNSIWDSGGTISLARSYVDLNTTTTSADPVPSSFNILDGSDTEVIELCENSNGNYNLKATKNPGYLYFEDGENYLKTDSTLSQSTAFDISTNSTSYKSSITSYDSKKSGIRYIQFNAISRFSGYMKTQKDIYLYKDNTTVSSISIESNPTKVNYTIGESINLEGFAVNGVLSNDKTVDVTRNCTVSPSTFTEAGTITVTVSCGTATSQTFTVEVANKTVDHIAVTTNPTKTNYDFGDTLDFSGIVVTKYYDAEGTDAVVCESSEYTINPTDGTALTTSGTNTITVTHTLSSKTTTFDVTVEKYVDVLEIGSKYAFSGTFGTNTYELTAFPDDKSYGTSYTIVKYLSLGLPFEIERGTYENTYKFKSTDGKYLYRYQSSSNNLYLGNPEDTYGDQGILEESWYVTIDNETNKFIIKSAYLPDDTKAIKLKNDDSVFKFGMFSYATSAYTYVDLAKVDTQKETQAFVENYMHPEIGIEDGKSQSTGECKTSGWFTNAETALNELSDDAFELFTDDEEFKDYYERYCSWESLQDKFTGSESLRILGIDTDNSATIAIAVISIVCLSSFALILINRKKKKENKE